MRSLVVIIWALVIAIVPAYAVSDTALLAAYCASFWQTTADDYKKFVQALPPSSTPPQGLQDGLKDAEAESKRALDYELAAMSQHVGTSEFTEFLVAANQAEEDYEACAQITRRSIQRLLGEPAADPSVLLRQRQAEQRAAPSCRRIKRCQESSTLPF